MAALEKLIVIRVLRRAAAVADEGLSREHRNIVKVDWILFRSAVVGVGASGGFEAFG